MTLFAPAKRIIEFCPSPLLWIIAFPVGVFTRFTFDTSTPKEERVSRSISPSSPTQPAIYTSKPVFAMAQAWLSPLPPAFFSIFELRRVSPGLTICSKE